MVRAAKRGRGRGRGRGRPPKHDPEDPPEFFKFYLPELSSKQLLIPSCFVERFLERVPKKLTLQNKNFEGKVWNVELEKAESEFFMKKGWESFVIDNSLEPGEFLTFAYRGNAVFTVKVFSTSGCKRGNIVATNDRPFVEVELEPKMLDISSHRTHDGEKMDIEREVILEPVCQDSLVVTEGVPDKTIEQKRVHFTAIIKKMPYTLHIPAAIFTENNVKPPKATTPEMILVRDQSGNSHEGRLTQRSDRVALTSGWKEFRSKNKMAKGDECEFDIILGEGRKIKEILLLRIIRRKTARTRKARLGQRPRNK